MSERIWFYTKSNRIVDLNLAQYFHISDYINGNFAVMMEYFSKDPSCLTLGVFESKEDAEIYLKEIYAILKPIHYRDDPEWKKKMDNALSV